MSRFNTCKVAVIPRVASFPSVGSVGPLYRSQSHHCAGTFALPAGDPIEFGAVAEVFGSLSGVSTPAPPLVLLSSKSWYGHSEPGAGVVGLIHSATAMRQAAVVPISHLRTLNPMVGNILEAAGYQAQPSAVSSSRGWVLPRGAAGWSGPQVVGTSAFAYQVGELGCSDGEAPSRFCLSMHTPLQATLCGCGLHEVQFHKAVQHTRQG